MLDSSTRNWLKKRYTKNTSKNYLMLPEERKRNNDIKKVFNAFDEDKSGTLDVEEVYNMFKENGIEVPIARLQSLFRTVSKGDSLNLQEFKAFVESEEANKSKSA